MKDRILTTVQRWRKPFDEWLLNRKIDKLTNAIYKYAFKDCFPKHSREDAMKIAIAIMWNDNHIVNILTNQKD